MWITHKEEAMFSVSKKILSFTFGVALAIVSTSTIWAANYELDNSHSSVAFEVSHLMVSTTKGEFTDYSGKIVFNKDDLKSFVADLTIKAESIDTRNKQRDDHLRSADFFDVAKFDTITFKSKKLEAAGDDYQLTGDLTMHGVTKEISLPLKISGPVKNPFGGTAIGLSGQTTINRKDFGILWNKDLDNGGVVVGEDVKVIINLEAHG